MPFDVTAFKRTFFDTAAVTDRLDPALKRALSKFGAFTRRRSRSSLRYGKGSSAPGRPPTVHRSARFGRTTTSKKTGVKKTQPSSPLRELLLFGYDAAAKSVVVGPALGGPQTDAPRLMEEGGDGTVLDHGRRVIAHFKPHPYMGPAFRAELAAVGDDFKNLIR